MTRRVWNNRQAVKVISRLIINSPGVCKQDIFTKTSYHLPLITIRITYLMDKNYIKSVKKGRKTVYFPTEKLVEFIKVLNSASSSGNEGFIKILKEKGGLR